MKCCYAISFALALVLAPGTRAADSANWAIGKTRLGLLQRAGGLLDKKVQDEKGKKLGTVSDFLLDLSTGQVIFILVAGNNDAELIPVPATTYSHLLGNRVVLGVEREAFAAAPRILRANPLSALEPERRKATFRYFQRPEPETAFARHDEFASAVRLANKPLDCKAGAPVGQVKELMLDISQGKIVYLIVAPNSGIASASDLYLVPPVAVACDGQRLAVNMELKKFLTGPRFQKEYWADLASPALAAEVQAQFGLPAGPVSVAPVQGFPGHSDGKPNS